MIGMSNYCVSVYSLISIPPDSDESHDDNSEYLFSNLEGHKLARKILQPQLPYDPHDAQIKDICKAIDGVDIMVLTPTGTGKTGYLTMYMLLVQLLVADSGLVKPWKKKVCQKLVMVNVFPTNGVEEEMVHRNSL